MTTYLTTIGTRISKRSLFHKLITGCGPVGRALDLGSRRREFESPHSDHKNRCFQTKTAVFNTFMHISFEPTASSAPHQESSLKSLFFVYCMPIFVRRYISFHIIQNHRCFCENSPQKRRFFWRCSVLRCLVFCGTFLYNGLENR